MREQDAEDAEVTQRTQKKTPNRVKHCARACTAHNSLPWRGAPYGAGWLRRRQNQAPVPVACLNARTERKGCRKNTKMAYGLWLMAYGLWLMAHGNAATAIKPQTPCARHQNVPCSNCHPDYPRAPLCRLRAHAQTGDCPHKYPCAKTTRPTY